MSTAHQNLSEYHKDGVPNAKKFRFGIVVSEWNKNITDNLYNGAYNSLVEHGVIPENIIHWSVPGSFELIYAAKRMQEQMVNAVIVIGSVIQGETKHFDFVCQGVTQGIVQLNVLYKTPVIFCVLTDNTLEQAQARSGGIHGNKGVEAAITAIKMAELLSVI